MSKLKEYVFVFVIIILLFLVGSSLTRARASPELFLGFLTLGLFIGVSMLLYSIGFFHALYTFFTVIYKTVEPRSKNSKILVVLMSILYGLFIVYIYGGPIGLLTPVFFNMLMFLIGTLIILVVGLVLFVILVISVRLLDKRYIKHTHRPLLQDLEIKTSTKPDIREKVREKKSAYPRCSICLQECTNDYFTCHYCNAVFCMSCELRHTMKQRMAGDFEYNDNVHFTSSLKCPQCGKPYTVVYHKDPSRLYRN